MDKNSILQYKSSFDNIVRYIESDDAKEQVEVWFARELQAILGLFALGKLSRCHTTGSRFV